MYTQVMSIRLSQASSCTYTHKWPGIPSDV